MAEVLAAKKACAVNPLKMSAPIGAALAFLGMERCLPLLHGAQGCTAFGLVLFVRHFRETIPLQTTAMNEITTILGGLDNLEQALVNIHQRARPALVGVISTGLTETRGDDVAGFLREIHARHPEFSGMNTVFVPAPDYVGGFADGWSLAVAACVRQLAQPAAPVAQRVNVLLPSHCTPADVEEIRDMVEAFGLEAQILPDLSGSLDGHVPESFLPHTLGGTSVETLRRMGSAVRTLALGEQTRAAAEALQQDCGVPYDLFERLSGLAACDRFLHTLAGISGRTVPARYLRQRSQLQDALLDGHFYFGGRRIAIGAEPDVLLDLAGFFSELGATVTVAVASAASPVLERVAATTVRIGDLEDLETAAASGCDLLVTHAHGRQAAARLGLPLLRVGLPIFDRLGAAARLSVGYRGTRAQIFEVGNLFIAADEHKAHAPVGEMCHA